MSSVLYTGLEIKNGAWCMTVPRLFFVARPAGFEPATYGFVVRHSIQLSYGRLMFDCIYVNEKMMSILTFVLLPLDALFER